jgi:hypothetical protein
MAKAPKKSVTKKKRARPKLSDTDRHARFVETARKVEASEDPAAFDNVFKKIVPRNEAKAVSKP